MAADVLTKPLQGVVFRKHRARLLNSKDTQVPQGGSADKEVIKRVLVLLRHLSCNTFHSFVKPNHT